MNEDNILGISVFMFLVVVCSCVAWVAWKRGTEREDFLPLADTV